MGIRPFSELPAFTDKLASRVQDAATRIMRDLGVGIGQTLVDTTRVDTGKARSNWRATLNAPASGIIPPYSPGNKLGIGETANASAAKSQQKSVIDRFNVKTHQAIFITNRVPYIGALNSGSPTNSADGMVEQAVLTGRAILKASKLVRRV